VPQLYALAETAAAVVTEVKTVVAVKYGSFSTD